MSMRHSSHSSSATSNSTASPKTRLSFFTKKRQSRDETGSSDNIHEPQHSDKILSSPFNLSDIEPTRSNGNLPSPDSFIGATHDTEYLHLRENSRRIRKAPSGSDPKKVDAVWEVYKKLREESLQLCKRLLQKSQNNHRSASFESTISPLDTGSLHSGSITETSLPFRVNDQWLTAIHEYKATQEAMLENLRTSLLTTYKAYEPEASERQLEAFLADKVLRENLIIKWRDASVHRMKSEKLLFWEQYKIRSLNFDKLRLDLQATGNLFNVADSGEAPNMAIREYVIAKNGDTILEFANAASEIYPILRFRVSSQLLAEASPSYFSKILSPSEHGKSNLLDSMNDFQPLPLLHTCKDGMQVRVIRMPQVELNNHEALTTLLHAAHMHNQKVPREIDFPAFVSIAEVCLRYQCTSPLELQVEYQWLPQWMHMAGNDESPDGFLLISYAFGLRGIFTRMSKTAILNTVDEDQIQNKELWPQAVRDKIKAIRSAKLAQIHECCTNTIEEYFRPPAETERKASVGSLVLTAVPRCPRGSHMCDATNLGWLMLVYNELKVLPSIVKNACFHDLPQSPRRSIKELVDCLRLMPSAPQVHSGVCDYAPAFRSAINDIYNSIQGLTLKDVSGKSGWALSKHAEEDHTISPEVHELPVPNKKETPTVSSNETICLQILSYLDDEDDLSAAAMIDKGFYNAYKRNEAVLLKTVMRAVRRRIMSTVTPEVVGARDALGIDIVPSPLDLRPTGIRDESKYLKSDNISSSRTPNSLYGVSPPYSPVSESETPMSAEEAHKILWPDDKLTTARPDFYSNTHLVEQNEKYLVGDVVHTEDKAIMQEDSKHLRDEKDATLGLGIYKASSARPI